MIVRLIALMVSGGLAYAMLQGWPEFISGFVRGCLSVILLLVGLTWWAAGSRPKKLSEAKGHRSPEWLDFGVIGMALLAIECGFLWLFSVAPEPLESAAIVVEERLFPDVAKSRKETEGELSIGGNWLWQSEQNRALPRRTNLKPGAKPEVFIRLNRKQDALKLLEEQIYVRAFTLDRYDGGVWSSGLNEKVVLESEEDGWIRLGGESKEGILHEVFHGNSDGGRDVMIALQGATGVRLPRVEKSSGGTFILPESVDSTGYQYFASSQPKSLADFEGTDTELVQTRGEKSNPRIRELAGLAAGSGTDLERLANIERFLRKGYGYSLSTENPKNIEPLENFLFHEKRGHCEFFATSAALMVRELGFESRIAYGWAGGQFFEINNTFVFRAREAHAWVEVNTEEHGWVVMEPTPPVVLGQSGRPSRAGVNAEFPETAEIFEEMNDTHASEIKMIQMLSLGLAVFFAFGSFVVIFMRRKTRVNSEGARVFGGRDEKGYLSAWKNAAAKLGIRQSGKTLKMQVDGLESRPEFADRLADYHYGISYEGKKPESDHEDWLETQIRNWKERSDF